MKKLFCMFFAVLIFFSQMQVSAEESAPAQTVCTALAEAQTGMLLEGEASDQPVPIGSQTKLMTILLTAEEIEAGTLSPETEITVSPAAEGVPGASVWLLAGERMTVSDLLKAVIIGNANDAAMALAIQLSGSEQRFVADMNAEAFSLGMRSTCFADCTGLSDENISTAYDLTLLCAALLRYPELTPYFTAWMDELRGGETELVNENRLVRSLSGIRGLKAGHGDACGYTLTLAAERDGMLCVAVVLGETDSDARFSAGAALIARGFSGYQVVTPDFSAEFLRPVTVRHGLTGAVLTESDALRAAAVPQGDALSCIVILPKYAEAPVRAGDVLGEIAFYCADTLLYEVPLTAAEDVPRRKFRDSLRMLFGNLFK